MRWIDPAGNVAEDCAVFFKVSEEFGSLSNMAGGYPLEVNDVEITSSEALYQALRFPDHPEIQQEIIVQASPMSAKMKAKKDGRKEKFSRADWNLVNVEIMRWCLRVKLVQHFDEFFETLMSTKARAIVERSRKDRFWGAVLEEDGALRGENRLGLLLRELRTEVKAWLYAADDDTPYPAVQPPDIDNFRLLGRKIGTVDAV